VGRSGTADVSLAWDTRVSSLHAELRHIGGHWLVIDDGLSRNGTYLNGTRVAGRRRLQDGDELEIGTTVLVFRDPASPSATRTESTPQMQPPGSLTEAQRRVLVALCQPLGAADPALRPATNREIAEGLHLSVPAVKGHLRALFRIFDVDGFPQNEKRLRLAHLALSTGTVARSELA